MIEWKRLYPKPAGSLPGGIVTQWGVAVITVLILIFVALWLASGGTEQAEIDSIGGEVTGPARNFAGQMAAAGRSRGATGRDAPGGGGADPTGAATPGGAGSCNGRDRRRAGDDGRGVATGRAES